MASNNHLLSSSEFKKYFSKVTRLCVDVVIKTPDGIILILRAIPPYKGKWHYPGGTVHYRETIKDAINRIADRELGVKVDIKRLLGYSEFPSEMKERGFGWSISLVFLCKIKSGVPTLNYEGLRIGFFKKLPKNMIK